MGKVERAAYASIKGYLYQFDHYIYQILKSTEDAKLTIEGIEDIDIERGGEAELVQCKYYSDDNFTNSKLRTAIQYMLLHFKSNSYNRKWTYTIYAHFNKERPESLVDVDLKRLKKILTYTTSNIEHKFYLEHDLTDDMLMDFIEVFKICFGLEFSVQKQNIINLISKDYTNGDMDVAEIIYYNQMLSSVCNMSKESDKNLRKVSKYELLSKAKDCEVSVHNSLMLKHMNYEEYLVKLKNILKKYNYDKGDQGKIIVIGHSLLRSSYTIADFIQDYNKKYFQKNESFYTNKPLTIVIDSNKKDRLKLKKVLLDNKIIFNDGYEEINFSMDMFMEPPVIIRTTSNRLDKASYYVKLISLDTYRDNFMNETLLSLVASCCMENVSIDYSKRNYPIKIVDLADLKLCLSIN